MFDKLSFMEDCLAGMIERGWNASKITMGGELTRGKDWDASYFYVYPAYINDAGVDVAIDSIYVPSYNLNTLEDKAAVASRLFAATPPIKEHKTKVLLEHIGKINELAAALNLSADFINPITALADQLRSNALPKYAEIEAAEITDIEF